jgi:acetyl esterase/lipase
MRIRLAVAVLASGAVVAAAPPASVPLMSSKDLAPLAAASPGMRLQYGQGPLQFGELILPPKGKRPYPVLIWIHGGCWLSGFDIAHSRAFARAAAQEGFAVWNIEYRRVGNDGGGWPGTFQDVAAAADNLRDLARKYPLDLDRVVAGGHSAGGQLALWLAARAKISHDSPLWVADPLPIDRVLALAPATGLSALHDKHACDDVIDKLVGGSAAQVPAAYAATEPNLLVPIAVPQTIIVGGHDAAWTWLGLDYAKAALRAAPDAPITVVHAPDSGHFEMIAPGSTTWPLVRDSLRSIKASFKHRRDGGS